ncbi:RNP domain protein [Blumeria hordei DH14]|uniref:RNP domain protein n=1 Tax=Blumeria graminis f. sp. hordei (strain DH14) TaxID=546991 RepID=N1JMW5_BLUG1|nr:RNP domain protein [Blumeria hordei DH14]
MSSALEQAADSVNNVAAIDQGLPDNQASADNAPGGAQLESVATSAVEGRRLYIGNLAYATTEGELQELFKGYLIESTSIPKNPRTDRPVGYAFVDLSTQAEAERAIAELSGKEILDRKVSVQLARKPETNGEKVGANGIEVVSGGEGEGGRRRPSGRGRGRGRGRASRGTRETHTEKEAEKPADDNPSTSEVTEQQTANSGEVVVQVEADSKEPKEKHTRTPRPRRSRGPPADGIPSKTKIMVANLPYDLSEEKLKELFVDFEPISAKIALRPIPRFMVKKLQARNEPRKGRGFGFISLASEELQIRAVAEMNGKEIEGREIAVKVAIDSPDKIADDADNQVTQNSDEGVGGNVEGKPQGDEESHAGAGVEGQGDVFENVA